MFSIPVSTIIMFILCSCIFSLSASSQYLFVLGTWYSYLLPCSKLIILQSSGYRYRLPSEIFKPQVVSHVALNIICSNITVVSLVSAHGCLNITRDSCRYERLPRVCIAYVCIEAAILTP